jgi:short subunit dehydrogenase-like uncharacterized protein
VNDQWLLYGATGRTGTLIAEQAVARGHRPLLAGRDPDRLRRLGERLDLPWSAGRASEVAGFIGDARLVLLAAGPFATTAPPVLRTCLDAGVHYLDIANEIPVASAVLGAGDTAVQRRITALPSVGFGTVASDGLARYVADQVPNAIQLDMAILLGTDRSSAGARASTMQGLARGGRVRRDGRLVRTRLGAGARRQGTPIGDRTLVPVPTCDLVVTGCTTGIPDITVSFPVRMPPLAAELAMPALPLIAWASGKFPTPARPSDPTKQPATIESYLWARATAGDGQTAEAWACTGEGYAYTARAAVLAVEATLGSEPLGATTVARAFGPELSFEAGGELIAAPEAIHARCAR